MAANNNNASTINYFPRSRKTESQYQRERRAALPDTPKGREREQQGKEAHTQYTKLTERSKRLDKAYKEERGKQREIFSNSFLQSSKPEAQEEGDYYTRNAAGLLPDQHEKLVKPACNRAIATLTMANARDRMFEDHPYHYRNTCQVATHENRRDWAFNISIEAQQEFETHHKYAGDPNSSKYGRRPPRS
ncbi:hypothetical protein BJY00DRAFT_295518 [Aspergillus carlsbadensis]|nr:hypothetical protein BJY00DRAFT_295518 [Aspergillus carlsbadensis]